jgi:hypothetical protein
MFLLPESARAAAPRGADGVQRGAEAQRCRDVESMGAIKRRLCRLDDANTAMVRTWQWGTHNQSPITSIRYDETACLSDDANTCGYPPYM